MKKFVIGFLFACAMVVPVASQAQTITTTTTTTALPAGCTSTNGFSPITGEKCDSYITRALPVGCTSTLGYSPLTGIKCDSYVNNSLPAGCTSTVGYSPLTGIKCDSNVNQNLPPGCTSTVGYSVTTGQRCDSRLPNTTPVDLILDEDDEVGYSKFVRVSIKGFSENRNVYRWELSTTCPSGVSFESSGSDPERCGKTDSFLSSNFYDPTRDYLIITGTAINNSNVSADVTFVLKAYNSSGALLGTANDRVVLQSRITPQPSIAVISPNGGEGVSMGDTLVVKWNSNLSASYRTNIYLSSLSDCEIGSYCPNRTTVLIGSPLNSVGSSGYRWLVPTNMNFGRYFIDMSILGTDNRAIVKDTSDRYFNIANGTTTTQALALTSTSFYGTRGGNPPLQLSLIGSGFGSTGQMVHFVGRDYNYNRTVYPLSTLANGTRVNIIVPTDASGGNFDVSVINKDGVESNKMTVSL